jgi:hypothetical protein
MDQYPEIGFQDVFTSVIGDMAKAVSERDGETREQQFARLQAATHMTLGFQPRDVIEAMLAGHCVMLHEIMTATVRTALSSDADTARRDADGSVIRLNKAFNDSLDRLRRYQQRVADGSRDAPKAEQSATPRPVAASTRPAADAILSPQPGQMAPAGNRAARRQAARADVRAAAAASRAAAQPGTARPHKPDPVRPPITPDLMALAETAAIGSAPLPIAVAAMSGPPPG